MNIPDNIPKFETPLSVMWFDEHGIFCSVTKKGPPLNKETLVQTFDYIQKHSGGQKICWLGEVTNAPPPEKAARDYAAEETPKFVKALALITNSSLSKLIAEIFLFVKRPPYPTKMFTSEADAKAWLRTF